METKNLGALILLQLLIFISDLTLLYNISIHGGVQIYVYRTERIFACSFQLSCNFNFFKLAVKDDIILELQIILISCKGRYNS